MKNLGIFDVLSESLHYNLPMDNQRYDDSFSYTSLKNIKKYCKSCIGKHAIFYHTEGRKELEPKLLEIIALYPYFIIGRYCCYNPEGEFRCFITVAVSYVDLYCGSSRLEILEDL
jgi:uncharacterized protein Veg